jgi:hypothetical protein
VETDPADLIVSASSSSTLLLPEGTLTLSGQDSSRSLFIAPALDAFGQAEIIVKVTDADNASAEVHFNLTVNEIVPVNKPPSRPYGIEPASGSPRELLPVTLVASAFQDADESDTHHATRWLIVRLGDDTTVLDVERLAPETLFTVPEGILIGGTKYGWQVSYRDALNWSELSPVSTFTTEFGLIITAIGPGAVEIRWEGDVSIESAPAVDGPWQLLPDPGNPLVISELETARYFRAVFTE